MLSLLAAWSFLSRSLQFTKPFSYSPTSPIVFRFIDSPPADSPIIKKTTQTSISLSRGLALGEEIEVILYELPRYHVGNGEEEAFPLEEGTV